MIASAVRKLLDTLADEDSRIEDLRVFPHWVMAHTRRPAIACFFPGMPGLVDSHPEDCCLGSLKGRPAKAEAAKLLESRDSLKLAAGMAILNSLLPPPEDATEGNAIERCAPMAQTCRSAFIGHFPDADTWREKGWPVEVVELFPQPGDLHWDASQEALAEAELVLLTGLTLINGTYGEVIRRTPKARIRVLVGPTVPLSPQLLGPEIQMVGSALVRDHKALAAHFSQGRCGIGNAPRGAIDMITLIHPSISTLLPTQPA